MNVDPAAPVSDQNYGRIPSDFESQVLTVTERLDPARWPVLSLDTDIVYRRSFVPTPLHWLIGGGFVLLNKPAPYSVRGWE